MKLVIDTKGNFLVLNITERSGFVLFALQDAKLYQRHWADDAPYEPAGTAENPEIISVHYEPDSKFSNPVPAIQEMAKAVEQSKKYWLDEYNQNIALKKEVEELKAKLAKIAHVTGEPDPGKGKEPEKEEQEKSEIPF